MTGDYPHGWEIWVEWQARSDWTVADGAQRLVESLRLVHRTWPDQTAAFRTGTGSKTALGVDDPGLPRQLARRLKASRNKNVFGDNDLFGDANLYIVPITRVGMSITCGQIATAAGWADGYCRVGVDMPLAGLLNDNPSAVTTLMAGLADVWQARNAWIDMVHVRQEWNQWMRDCPVYGWATWLHPRFATVDTTGLDADVTETAGGLLITLRADPAAMADPDGDTGKATIRELARRTVLADGRALVDVNDRLRQVLAGS